MKILAFLQNQWVRDPERVKAMIEKGGDDYRRRFIEYALFAGCLTGQRLKAAFGEELCQQIIWEESSREIGGHSGSKFPPDAIHIRQVIETEKPDLILSFSAPAFDVIDRIVGDSTWVIACPHPANRRPDTIQRLRKTAEITKDIVKNGLPAQKGVQADAFAAAHNLTTIR